MMITEKDYLKAKQIVKEYESKKEHNIAVISLNVHDFKLWKSFNNLKEDKIGTEKKFRIKNTRYHCISKVKDLCSLGIDEIIETNYAKENKEYEEIKLVARNNLNEQ